MYNFIGKSRQQHNLLVLLTAHNKEPIGKVRNGWRSKLNLYRKRKDVDRILVAVCLALLIVYLK